MLRMYQFPEQHQGLENHHTSVKERYPKALASCVGVGAFVVPPKTVVNGEPIRFDRAST